MNITTDETKVGEEKAELEITMTGENNKIEDSKKCEVPKVKDFSIL